MPDIVTVSVTESGATLTVVSQAVTISPVSGGSGGLLPLSPNPSGTFVAATVTINEFGLTTAASNTPDIASEATQQQILADLNLLSQAMLTGIDAGYYL